MNTSKVTFNRGDKQIIFLGACHIGTKEYYNQLTDVLNGFEEKQVIYEMIKSSTRSNLSWLHAKIGESLGLVLQKDGITYNDNWVWGDLSIESLNSINGEYLFSDFEEDKFKDFDSVMDFISNNRKIVKFVIEAIIWCSDKFGKSHPITGSIRNYNLIIKTFEVLRGTDKVCIFFGDAHLKEIQKILISVGFIKEKTEFIKAF